MDIKNLNFWKVGLLLASVFAVSCTSINNGDSYAQDNQYCFFSGQGCALIGDNAGCRVSSAFECQNFGGIVKSLGWCNVNFDPSKVFGCDVDVGYDYGYCLLYGECYYGYTQLECNYYGGTFYENSCPATPTDKWGSCTLYGSCYYGYTQSECNSYGGSFYLNDCSTQPSTGQYCYAYGECDLIGTSSRCYVSSTSECQSYGGSLKTLEWCNSNVGSWNTYGCDYEAEREGYCLLYGTCYYGYTQSDCNYYGGTFYENSCPATPTDKWGSCTLYGSCYDDIAQSDCNYYGGSFSESSCYANPSPSSGQYCYNYGYCDLIGTGYGCYYNSTTECINDGHSVKTLEWCNANVSSWNIYGCDY